MASRFVSPLALVVLALAAQAAPAQIAPGFSGNSTLRSSSGEEAWRSLGQFGICYAEQNPKKAFELIATEPGSRTEVEVYKAMFRKAHQSCLGSVSELRVHYTMVRGALAEGLYKRRVALPPQLAQTAPEPGTLIRNLSAATRCYASAHPDRTRALIEETNPGSRKEAEAIDAMMPDFDKCLPGGVEVRFDYTQLRFRLAEALYRMSPSGASVGES